MTINSTHSYIATGLSKNIDLTFLENIISESNSQKFNNRTYIHGLNHISHLTGVDYFFLHDIMTRKENPYKIFFIRKNLGNREIKEPNQRLKLVQRTINQQVLSKIPVHWRCFSYHKGASIVKCASEHLGAKSLVKFDISDFFGNINELLVYKSLIKLKYSGSSSYAMARLCTHPNSENDNFGVLPQGAPTSPSLSNLVFFDVDCKLQRLAHKNNLIYSRYADDITFSSFNDLSRQEFLDLKLSVVKILKYHNFELNRDKIKFISSSTPKFVLGINVGGETLKLSKRYKNDIDCHIYGLKKYGLVEHMRHREFTSVFGMIQELFGKINHAKSVEESFGLSRESELRNFIQTKGLFFN
ncbi:RNA-directed DNA polymerase [Pseudoalteromonas sp. NSLLW24]|uniref:reverse transcriptase family protein n=1 Tax=Pseudoalteromonas sp. NSLLW24 TaxID=2792050 RepID=UPI0018CF89CE|nr:reverse transcriptase family protein [Pseudoalteromonas sp. NSLLW24]MBH0000298.1 RNA-directed DNA polymerase [Pseudoalteromonas sp. NSLLW24]